MHFMVLQELRTLNEPYPIAAPAARPTGRAASQHAMPKQKLTNASLCALRPGQNQIDYWYTSFAGFGVRASPGGRKTRSSSSTRARNTSIRPRSAPVIAS